MSETARLLEAARAGDRDALDDLYLRHEGRLRAFVASRLGPGALVAAEDVVQETHLESVRKIGEFVPRAPSSFYRWLVTIARFKIAEARRTRARAEAPLDGERAGSQTSPSGAASRAELVARALDAMTEEQAEAVRLRYLEGLTVAEAAERMERTAAAVKMLVSRGLASLSRALPPGPLAP